MGKCGGGANAALGVINRAGLGKTRHIDTGLLWIQQVAADKRLKFGKVLGSDNPADLFTKYLDERTNVHHTTSLGFHATEGRAEDAPQLHAVSVSVDDYYTGGICREWEWIHYLWGKRGQLERPNNNGRYRGELGALEKKKNENSVAANQRQDIHK